MSAEQKPSRSGRTRALRRASDEMNAAPQFHPEAEAGSNFYLVACAGHREFRLRQGRQARYLGCKVAFMGTTDEEVASTERTNDLRHARNE